MPTKRWRCECGAKYEVPQERLGMNVRCSRCGAVAVIRKPSRPAPETLMPIRDKITLPAAPPPLPKSGVPSKVVSGESSIRHVLRTAIIVASGTVMLLLLALMLLSSSTQQQHAEKAQPPSVATQSAEPSESVPIPDELEEVDETDRPFTTPKEPFQESEAAAPAAEPQSIPPTGKILELADLAELVGPSVVQVNVNGPEARTGSGFVLDKQGTIVTNYHVIEDATAGTIVFSDRTSAPITGYLGVWPEKDIALLRVECSSDKLHPLHLATSTPRQGERVATFGSPLGLQQSMSEGIVSAIRESEELRNIVPTIDINALLIQMTALLLPGNSGGPLVDMKGMVVGVNTLGIQGIGGENINFAVAATELTPLILAKNETPSPLPANDPAGSVRRIVRRAGDHVKADEYDLAIADCTKAIRLDPENAGAYVLRGLAYYYKDDYDNAIADYTEAIRLEPKKAFAHYMRGSAYGYTDDYDNAIADFTEAIRLEPKKASAYYMRGSAYYYKDDYDNAIADYTEAIRLEPKKAHWIWQRGRAYELKGRQASAKRDFEEARRLGYDPPDAEPL